MPEKWKIIIISIFAARHCRQLDDDAAVDVLIVGGDPMNVATGVDAGLEWLNALVVEDIAIGDQEGASRPIETYMGFPIGI